jgi:hypothetical protein
MKFIVNTIVHARITIEARSETAACEKAEQYAKSAFEIGDCDNIVETIRAVARDAEDVL